MFLSTWMGKGALGHQDNAILFTAKRKWALKPWKDLEEARYGGACLQSQPWSGRGRRSKTSLRFKTDLDDITRPCKNNLGKNKWIFLRKRSQHEKTAYGMIPTIIPSLKRQNSGDSKKSSGCQELRGGRGKQSKHRGFFRALKILFNSAVVAKCHYKFMQIDEIHNLKSGP